jgi:glycosyltransferase involved in cell wall biosynthesis
VCGQIAETEGDMSYLAQARGIEPIMVASLGREISPVRDLATLWQLVRLMRRFRPDVVHTHTAKAGFVGRLAAWIARVPVRVHTFHGHVFHGYFRRWKTRLFLWLEWLSARISSRVITISPALADELVETYRICPAEKMVVLPLGLDLEPLTRPKAPETAHDFRTAHHIPLNRRLVGIIGRLVPIKNVSLFLQAASQIVAERDDVQFVVIGDGDRRPQLEAEAQSLGIAEQVTFTGWVQDVQLPLSALDVLALTSNNEGTPVSIIEAMAAGVPVVATAVGGVPDVLGGGEYGQLVPTGDARALATGIQKALAGEHPPQDRAREAALSQYGINGLASALEALYYELLAENQ